MHIPGMSHNGQTRLRTLARGIWTLIKPFRGAFLAGTALMIVGRLCGFALPVSSKFLIEKLMHGGDSASLVWVVIGIALATLAQAAASFGVTYIASGASQRLIYRLRVQLQEHVVGLPVSFYETSKVGSLVSLIMNDAEGLRNLVGTSLLDLAGGLLTTAISVVLLFRINPQMTVLALFILSVSAMTLRRFLTNSRPLYRERGRIHAEVTGRLTETLGGVRLVKSYRAEERESAVFSAGVERLQKTTLAALRKQAFSSTASTAITGLIGALIMVLGARQIGVHSMSLADFVLYSSLLAYLVSPMTQVVSVGSQMSEALASFERIERVLRKGTEDEDPRRTTAMARISGHICFRNVSFAYDNGPFVLHDLSFDARPGTVTALVGHSGSGKSTMMNLLAAFHTPAKGTILVDGVDLSTVLLTGYRQQLGLVLQDSFLFEGTILDNVAFSRPNARKEEVIEACRLAYVDEFAEKLPEQYQTIVGERGIKLSGGQKQRVSIARAILANPRILILDEATSSLDSESEAMIQSSLAFLMRGRTTFVIAHRLTTICSADQILVMECGRITERGQHEELFAAKGRYYQLYTRQQEVQANLLPEIARSYELETLTA
jgi:subfamily B ATP-binding cassette protein MsbA